MLLILLFDFLPEKVHWHITIDCSFEIWQVFLNLSQDSKIHLVLQTQGFSKWLSSNPESEHDYHDCWRFMQQLKI